MEEEVKDDNNNGKVNKDDEVDKDNADEVDKDDSGDKDLNNHYEV